MAEIAPPNAACTNAAAYEMPGEKATGGRTRPRARTHGEDEVTDTMKNLKVGGTGGPTSPAFVEPSSAPLKKESAATSILRRFSTRRRKDVPERNVDKHYPP